MHDHLPASQVAASALFTAIGFAVGITVGLNATSRDHDALAELGTPTVSAPRAFPLLPPLPPEIAKAYVLGYPGMRPRAGESFDCTLARNDRCGN